MNIIMHRAFLQKYVEFKIRAYLIELDGQGSFILNNEKENEIDRSYLDSMRNASYMSEFYKVLGADRKCHVETLLSAFMKNRRFKSTNYLVDLIYYLELRTGLLMGIHDLRYISGNVNVFIADGGESFEHISGKPCKLQAGSICISDDDKIFASLTDGPDSATKVVESTIKAILFIFLPPKLDVNSIYKQLEIVDKVFRDEGLKVDQVPVT